MDQDDALLTAIMMRAQWAADQEQIGHYIRRARLKQHAPDVRVRDRVIEVSGLCNEEFAASFSPMRGYCPNCVITLRANGQEPPQLTQAAQLTGPTT